MKQIVLNTWSWIQEDYRSYPLRFAAEFVALVLDIHHHWVNSGEYIEPTDPRVRRVLDSWRGVRPLIHLSTSREDVLIDHCENTRPNLATLLSQGYKKQKLRAHSDFLWNRAVNDWSLTFAHEFDIEVEAKGKNLASEMLYNRAKELGL